MYIVVGKFWDFYLISSTFHHIHLKKLKTEKEDTDTFRFNFYFQGLWLFYGEKCFPEPVEMAMLSHTRHLKSTIESSLANYKFEGLPCVSVFSGYIQLRLLLAGDTMYYW